MCAAAGDSRKVWATVYRLPENGGAFAQLHADPQRATHVAAAGPVALAHALDLGEYWVARESAAAAVKWA